MRKPSKTLEDLERDIVRVFGEYETTGTNRWTYQTALLDLQYQVGCLTKRAMQLHGDRFGEGRTAAQLRGAVGDELADLLAEVIFIAHDMDLDLAEAWETMLQSDGRKVSERAGLVRRRQAS